MVRDRPRGGVRRNQERTMVMLDLFAGVARASKAFVDLNHTAYTCDINDGPISGTADPKVLSNLLWKIRQGHFDCAMMAPPCATFSTARHAALRSASCPWGLLKQRAILSC